MVSLRGVAGGEGSIDQVGWEQDARSAPWTATESRLARWDIDEVRRRFVDDDQLLVAPNAFAREDVRRLVGAADRLRPSVVRKAVPSYKKSGSVSYADARVVAPELDALYRSPRVIRALSQIAGAELHPCPDWDLHACALYYYTEPGDWIGWHYDTSHYRGARYTVLVGVVNQTESSRLQYRLWTREADREQPVLELSTDPGTLVFFNGDRLYHAVSKLGEGEERVILTLEYVTDPHMNPLRRLVSDLKDAATYFGFRRKRR